MATSKPQQKDFRANADGIIKQAFLVIVFFDVIETTSTTDVREYVDLTYVQEERGADGNAKITLTGWNRHPPARGDGNWV